MNPTMPHRTEEEAALKRQAMDQSFRDTIATIDAKGHRNRILPKKPSGPLYTRRTLASLVYLAVFFTLPFIERGGEPLFMINVLKRKFILFGQIFGPEDFFIFMLGMLTFMVFIIVFTVVFGRVFCGWACPQTVFMEMVFRKVEYWIDGDASQQRRLKEMPWNGYKIRKRTLKVAVFWLMSFVIAHFFMAYLIGMDEVRRYMQEGVGAHKGTFAALVAFSTVFFFVFHWFREQVCIVVCPYGRLQGVLLDKDSIVVAYDYVRGEPRGKAVKGKADVGRGDCIDCAACVRVCPTGIDIRSGTQLECVNCTACIDACDDIMKTVGKPKRLIRFASENNVAKGEQPRITTRMVAYSAVLLGLVTALALMLATRKDVDVTILRATGSLYQEMADGRIANVYNARMANKTRREVPLTLRLTGIHGEIELVGKDIVVGREAYGTATFIVKVPRDEIRTRRTPFHLQALEEGRVICDVAVTFMGPVER
jgi:cytochrome c oxidase accessory protein FixG